MAEADTCSAGEAALPWVLRPIVWGEELCVWVRPNNKAGAWAARRRDLPMRVVQTAAVQN